MINVDIKSSKAPVIVFEVEKDIKELHTIEDNDENTNVKVDNDLMNLLKGESGIEVLGTLSNGNLGLDDFKREREE